jgi:hypothetical protein
MISELRKVYKCEHCGKRMLGAGAMGYHEKWCKKNPSNRHKCFALCSHLKRNIKVIGFDGEDGQYRYEFICLKTGNMMYSYKLERKALYGYFKIPKNLIRMPLECSLYQEMSFDEQEECFGL